MPLKHDRAVSVTAMLCQNCALGSKLHRGGTDPTLPAALLMVCQLRVRW